jgi:hypothetical protein
MVRRIILGLVVAGVLVLGFVGYRNWSRSRDMMSGEVKNGPSLPGDAAATPANQPTPVPAARPSAAAKVQASDPSSPQAALPSAVPAAIPASDTIAPNPPNGLAYAGSGRFEVYRQGDLTWRINTDTGRACILFATNEEWRKPEVYRRGCGSSGFQ